MSDNPKKTLAAEHLRKTWGQHQPIDATLTPLEPLSETAGMFTIHTAEGEERRAKIDEMIDDIVGGHAIPEASGQSVRVGVQSHSPLIRKGEQVIWNGALICEVKRDIFRGEVCSPGDFQWFITPPKASEVFDAFPGFRTGPYGQPDIFLNGQWLSERNHDSHTLGWSRRD